MANQVPLRQASDDTAHARTHSSVAAGLRVSLVVVVMTQGRPQSEVAFFDVTTLCLVTLHYSRAISKYGTATADRTSTGADAPCACV